VFGTRGGNGQYVTDQFKPVVEPAPVLHKKSVPVHLPL